MHVRRVLALALSVPLLVAGCTDEPEPTPKMPDPTTSSPTPTPTETAEAESAEDFIRRWVEEGDEMQVSGETSEYRSLVDQSCKACRSFVESVEDVYETGGSVEFAGSTIDKIAMREKQPPTFAVTKSLPKTVIRREEGTAPEVLPAGKTTLLVILSRGNGEGDWTIKYYGVL